MLGVGTLDGAELLLLFKIVSAFAFAGIALAPAGAGLGASVGDKAMAIVQGRRISESELIETLAEIIHEGRRNVKRSGRLFRNIML